MSLDAIVRDVLQFARDMKIRPVATSPRLVIDEVLDQCEQLIVSAGIEVEVGVESEPTLEPPLDTCLMTRAIGNIVRNAVEAMAEAGARPRRLRLSYGRRAVRCPDGRHAPRVVIAVEDTGPGIPPEVVSRMFNPFFTTRTTGTGLGLAIVHRIVDAHGGHINVRNRERGGACVELCLPERHDDAARPAPAEEEVPIEVVLPRGASPTIHVQSH